MGPSDRRSSNGEAVPAVFGYFEAFAYLLSPYSRDPTSNHSVLSHRKEKRSRAGFTNTPDRLFWKSATNWGESEG